MYSINTMQTFLRSDERKAAVKSAASRTIGTVQRALQQANAAIAENTYSQASFARLQVCVAREF